MIRDDAAWVIIRLLENKSIEQAFDLLDSLKNWEGLNSGEQSAFAKRVKILKKSIALQKELKAISVENPACSKLSKIKNWLNFVNFRFKNTSNKSLNKNNRYVSL